MSSQDEREHCESVARKFESEVAQPTAYDDDWTDFDRLLADIIERERAAARAQGRAETLADLAQLTESEGFKHTPVVLRSLASWLEGRRTGGSNG